MAQLDFEASTTQQVQGTLLMWWQSWLGRSAVQWPWLVCAFAYVAFAGGGQGQTALEYPVARPLTGIALIGILIGMCFEAASTLARIHRAATPVPVVMLADVWPALRQSRLRALFLDVRSGEPRLWSGLLVLLLLGGVLASGVTTVASNSALGLEPPLLLLVPAFVFWAYRFAYWFRLNTPPPPAPRTALVWGAVCGLPLTWIGLRGVSFLVVYAVAILSGILAIECIRSILVIVARPFSKRATTEFAIAAAPVVVAIILYAISICLLFYDLSDVVDVGAHALVGSGLLVFTLFCIGWISIFVIIPTRRLGWLLLALGVVLYWLQSPIEERPNPLLVEAPKVTQASGACKDSITSADKTTTVSEVSGTPSLLISAEGGGIRAAYWTAVSLEELSEARNTPLIADTAIFSGVSGGSLGVATFLAAQQLPAGARLPCIREFLSGDFLSPLVAGLLFLDVPRLILPRWFISTHRGDYFESFMARRWLTLTGSDYFYLPLARLAGDNQQKLNVYLNATDALSGEYVALPSHRANAVNAPHEIGLTPLNSAVLNHLPDLRIAQAVHMSARFPYISPNPDLRAKATEVAQALFGFAAAVTDETTTASLASLVDGGYFDNSGLWPAFRLLQRDRKAGGSPQWSVIHIVNDQARDCDKSPPNTGCIRAESSVIKEDRLSNSGGWLSRPLQAIDAVRAAHALQSVKELELAQSQLKSGPFILQVPMPALRPSPWIADVILGIAARLPIHGRDTRYGGVALAWTLAPEEREFLCNQAALVRTKGLPDLKRSALVDRSKECSSAGSAD